MARFHEITDTRTGETRRVPFTPEEEAARDVEDAEFERQNVEIERQRDIERKRQLAEAALRRQRLESAKTDPTAPQEVRDYWAAVEAKDAIRAVR